MGNGIISIRMRYKLYTTPRYQAQRIYSTSLPQLPHHLYKCVRVHAHSRMARSAMRSPVLKKVTKLSVLYTQAWLPMSLCTYKRSQKPVYDQHSATGFSNSYSSNMQQSATIATAAAAAAFSSSNDQQQEQQQQQQYSAVTAFKEQECSATAFSNSQEQHQHSSSGNSQPQLSVTAITTACSSSSSTQQRL